MDLSLAEDKNGVSPNTVSLPSGPGSIEGLGESFKPMLNTGSARYAVKIAIPAGVAGNTPKLTLQYDSGLGDGPVGIGWTYGPGSISRQVDKGIPRYVDGPNDLDDDHDGEIDEANEEDTFIGPDGEELVRVSANTFRARIEGNFARYRRVNNHWEVDLKKGTALTFGATQATRISDKTNLKIFRWLLEKSMDTNGNVIEYSYTNFPGSDNQKYLREIRWGPGTPQWDVFYFASFTYEDRPDWRKDFRSGFLVKTAKRLAGINIGIQGVQPQQCAVGDWNNDTTVDALISRYTITYDDSSSHISHLTKITRYGSDGINYLPPITFSYSIYTPPESMSAKGEIVKAENVPGTVMDSELVDLIDLNRDGLPDILKTDFYGNSHTAYRNLGSDQQGTKEIIRWDEARLITSEDSLALPLHLVEDRVNLADMNGDGISDLVHTTLSGEVFYFPNRGDFSWGARQPMSIQDTAPPAPFAFDWVETADLDFNKRMDVVKSTDTGYSIWFNLEDGKYSSEIHTAGATHQGRVILFDEQGVQLADMNGDRLSDVAWIRQSEVIYGASMGHGNFYKSVTMPIPDTVLTDGENGQVKKAKLTDINGDGLDDLVVERAQVNELWFWLNRGTDSFSAKHTISDMPGQFGPNTEVRWADLNGNGTEDIIYADSSAVDRLRMLDIGKLAGGSAHSNLMIKIDNGLGAITDITYESSTDHYLAAQNAEEPWTTTVPFPVAVVSQVTNTASLDADGNGETGDDKYIKDYIYRDGFYEDREKQFRGFAEVKVTTHGDETAPTKVGLHSFFTGGPDGVDNDNDGEVDEVSAEFHREEDALKGLVRALELRAEDGTLFTRDENNWLVKNLLVSSDGIEVRFAYNEQADSLIYEGTDTPETIRTTFTYDDYGNVTEKRSYGALSITGDEVFAFTEYINDTSLWIIGMPKRNYVTDAAATQYAETLSYYDGDDYVGLPSGQLTKGQLTRQQRWVEGTTYVDLIRNAYDAYGNLVGTLSPNGTSRSISWDSILHSYPVSESIEVGGGNPDLTITGAYNIGLGVVTSSVDFNGHQTTYGHDTFGRLTSILRPGDSAEFPTQTFEYTLADPANGLLYSYDSAGTLTLNPSSPVPSSVKTFAREVSGQPGTYDVVQYVDGMGRKLALLEEAEQDFIVKDATLFDGSGTAHLVFLPYGASVSTYTTPPLSNNTYETRYDAAGRAIQKINPPDNNSIITSSQITYLPFRRIATDENNISKSFLRDGQDRLVEVHEENGGETYVTRYSYDPLGNITKITDAQNNVKTMQFNGLSRKTAMDDPDQGHTDYDYDAAGNLIQVTDNKGQITQYTYDGTNRMLTKDYLDAAGITPDVTYRYDAASAEYHAANNLKGKLAWLKDLSGDKYFSHDARGNIEWSIKRIVDGAVQRDFRNEFQYDALGRVTNMTYPDGDQISYTYNSGSKLDAVPGIVDSIDYHPSGAIETIAYTNGVTTNFFFDPRHRMTSLITDPALGGDPLQNIEYTFDGMNNITAIGDYRSVAANDPSNASQAFEYDDLYRLTQAQGSGYGAIDFQYDKIGNIISKKSPDAPDPKHITDPLINLGTISSGGTLGTSNRGTRQPGAPPGPHAVTGTQSGLVYNYDDNGNMTSHATGDIYEWDFINRLVKTTVDAKVTEYVYDNRGQRVIKKMTENGTEEVSWYVNNGFDIREGKPVKYVFAGNRRVARIDGRSTENGEQSSQNLHFYAGWNFFSLDVEPDDPAIATVLGSIAGNYTEVWAFDVVNQQYIGYVPGDGINDLSEIHARQGYVIHVTSSEDLLVSGTRTTDDINLLSSWNLIPCPADSPTKVTDALIAITGQYESVWYYDTVNDAWQGNMPDESTFINNFDIMYPGKCYWVKMKAAATIPFQQQPLKIHFFHPDHLGSSSLMTDITGAVVERTQFYPFGRPRYEERTDFDSAYKYTGKELDKETGLMYYEARYYEPVVGKFVSMDPLMVNDPTLRLARPQNLNLYAYASNSPIVRFDNLGLEDDESDDESSDPRKTPMEFNPDATPADPDGEAADHLSAINKYNRLSLPIAYGVAQKSELESKGSPSLRPLPDFPKFPTPPKNLNEAYERANEFVAERIVEDFAPPGEFFKGIIPEIVKGGIRAAFEGARDSVGGVLNTPNPNPQSDITVHRNITVGTPIDPEGTIQQSPEIPISPDWYY